MPASVIRGMAAGKPGSYPHAGDGPVAALHHGMRYLAVLLVGCVDSQPAPQCPENPRVLFFRSVVHAQVHDPQLAVGGTFDMALSCMISDLPGDLPLDRPFAVRSDSDAVTATASGNKVTLHGVHDGTTTVRVMSPDGAYTYDSLAVTTRQLDHLSIAGDDDAIPAGSALAFSTEWVTLAHARLTSSDGHALLDDSAQYTFPAGSSRSDSIGAPLLDGLFDYGAVATGDHDITVASGGATYTAPFPVVDRADAIAQADPTVTIAPGGGASICFDATNAGRFVAGLHWFYTIEGRAYDGGNCTQATAHDDINGDALIPVKATAGGQTLQVSVPIR